MDIIVTGIVRDGHVVPDAPLPEGAQVQVRLIAPPELPDELRDEIAAWNEASDRALSLIEEPPAVENGDATR